MKAVLTTLVRAYRLAISPLFPPRCRFLPSCSDYALQAIDRHGALAGTCLALRRFLRCHPFSDGGIDEVPEALPEGPEGPEGPGGWGRRIRFACLCHPSSLSRRGEPGTTGSASTDNR